MKRIRKIRISFEVLFTIFLVLFVVNTIVKMWPRYVTYLFVGFSVLFLFLVLIIFSRENLKKRLDFLERRVALWNHISYRVDIAGEKSFNNLDVGIFLYNEKYVIEWANGAAKQIFKNQMVSRDITMLSEELFINLSDEKKAFDITIYDKIYHCETLKNERIVYLKDVTRLKTLEKLSDDEALSIGILNLDNLQVALNVFDASEKSVLMANILEILTRWTARYNMLIKGYSEERYLIVTNQKTLNLAMNDEFKVLDEIREYASRKGIRIALSVGFASKRVAASKLMEEATESLDMAIKRGGNQAVVKIDNEFLYYGAKIESFDTRSSISVFHKTEEFIALVKKYQNCLVMGHIHTDTDSFGAAIGMRKIVESLGKECKIVYKNELVDETVRKLFKTIEKEHSNFLSAFVTPQQALNLLKENTLLIIVDDQYRKTLMDEKVYKKAKHIAIIDHHRRSPEAIDNTEFLYVQPSASSTVELICEMIPFIKTRIEISPIEATWMTMGVIIDTNNFVYRTSERTFAAMTILEDFGANMILAHEKLRNEKHVFKEKAKALSEAEIYADDVAITLASTDAVHSPAVLAMISDEMITIDGVKLAFTIGYIGENKVGISGRSFGSSNVQLIAEHFGGGGHFTAAAAQILNKTPEEVKNELIEYIISIKTQGDDLMKVILQKDVKGKGVATDVISVPTGYGNYLIKQGLALEATDDNLKRLQEQNDKKILEAKKELNDARNLKVFIENNPVSLYIKLGLNNKAFGTVSNKKIVEAYAKEHGVNLDKRKLVTNEVIDQLGTYRLSVQLHKEVVASLTVFVKEEGGENGR